MRAKANGTYDQIKAKARAAKAQKRRQSRMNGNEGQPPSTKTKLQSLRDKKAAKSGNKIAPEAGSASPGDASVTAPSEPTDGDDQRGAAFEEDKRRESAGSIPLAAIAKPENVRRASLTEEDYHAHGS